MCKRAKATKPEDAAAVVEGFFTKLKDDVSDVASDLRDKPSVREALSKGGEKAIAAGIPASTVSKLVPESKKAKKKKTGHKIVLIIAVVGAIVGGVYVAVRPKAQPPVAPKPPSLDDEPSHSSASKSGVTGPTTA